MKREKAACLLQPLSCFGTPSSCSKGSGCQLVQQNAVVCCCCQLKALKCYCLEEWSSTFLVPRASFLEDSSFTDGVWEQFQDDSSA